MSLLSLLRGTEERTHNLDNWDVPWGSPLAGTVNEVTALNLSAVWACETLIADAVAGMPVDVYRKSGPVSEEITKPSFFDYPNPDDTKIDFDTQRVLSLLGWGNAYVYLTRRGDSTSPAAPIVSRRVIDPWTVQVRRIGGVKHYFVNGAEVPAGNIQHIPGYRRPGAVTGMSVIANAHAGLSETNASQELAQNLYQNGLNTSGVISMPQLPDSTSADTIQRLTDKIREWYAGSKNAGKPLVLTGGTTWQPMSVTPHDAQFLDTRLFQVNEIARWFRVPPHMIQHLDGTTSWGTGIEQQSLGFVRYTLMPWIVRLEQSDSALLPRPQFVKYNVNSLIRADLKTRFEAYQIARNGGWMSANEVREYEDEPPIPNGDIYLQPLNFVEAGTTPPAPQAPAMPPPARSSDPMSLTVNVEAPEPPAVSVEGSTFHVDARQHPTVNVPATVVNVPEPKVVIDRAVTKKVVHRDENGQITHTTEERA